MKYDPEIHKRRSIRLKGYDYSQSGLYFITICVQNREGLFGNIENMEMKLNDAGKIIVTEWMNLKTRFPNIELNEFVVMPNHFHGRLWQRNYYENIIRNQQSYETIANNILNNPVKWHEDTFSASNEL